MIKELIDNALAKKQSVIIASEDPLSDGNKSLSRICGLYPTLTVINPALPSHAIYVVNKLPQHVIVIISEFLNRDIINRVCEYAMEQSVIFLVDKDSPELDSAFSNKCVMLSI